MKIFSALAGIQDVTEEQNSTSETSLSDEDPHLSFSTREVSTQKNRIEEIDIRMKDFQEVTFFTTRSGRPLEAAHGKVEFLNKSDWSTRERCPISFSSSGCQAFLNKNQQMSEPAIIEETYYADCYKSTPFTYFESAKVTTNVTNTKIAPDASLTGHEENESIDDIL